MTIYREFEGEIASGTVIPLFMAEGPAGECENCGGRGFVVAWKYTNEKSDNPKFIELSGYHNSRWYTGRGNYRGKTITETCPMCHGIREERPVVACPIGENPFAGMDFA